MKLACQQYGEGFPLVILHGLLGSGDNWRTLSRQVFSEKFSVYALDLRNHGDSPHHEHMDYPTMADDVRQFLVDHDLPSCHLIGHSMGGKVAMEFALAHPERIDRLVIADIAPRAYSAQHDEILSALESLDLGAVNNRKDADSMLAEQLPSVAVRQFLLKNLERVEDGEYRWKMNLSAIVENYESISGWVDRDGSFGKPALFIRGERSNYVTPADEGLIHSAFPHAEIVTIGGAGHWVHAEAPQQFGDAVMKFLEAQ